MILVAILKIIFIIITLYLAFFSLWRTFEREHVDDIPVALDRVILASLLAWYLARIPNAVDLLLTHSIQPLALFNPLVAAASWQVGMVLFIVILSLLMRDTWRDKYGILDFVVVVIPVFLAGYMLWQLTSLVLTCVLTQTPLPIGYLITLIVGSIYFLVFSRLLAYFERQYRAFFWYRYRRSSAQTGFVTSAYFIGSGLFGMIGMIYQIPFGVLSLPMFLTVWSLFTCVGGFILLYVRSGRLKKR